MGKEVKRCTNQLKNGGGSVRKGDNVFNVGKQTKLIKIRNSNWGCVVHTPTYAQMRRSVLEASTTFVSNYKNTAVCIHCSLRVRIRRTDVQCVYWSKTLKLEILRNFHHNATQHRKVEYLSLSPPRFLDRELSLSPLLELELERILPLVLWRQL